MSNTKLAFNNRKKLALHKLPFVGRRNGPGKFSISFWDVPRAGGYFGGCKTGKALALIYLQHLKENGSGTGGMLQHITFDMLDGCDDDARSGQVVGFFTHLESWLSGAVKHLEGGLDEMPEKQLLQAANDGLAFDEEAYLASLPDDE